MTEQKVPIRTDRYVKKVGLVLQGGGSSGQLSGRRLRSALDFPILADWIAGISIGAINAAIIAGNAPDKRVEHLRAFWE